MVIGIYLLADEATMKSISLSGNIKEAVVRYDGEETTESYEVGKLWDGLHFLLTGIRACKATKQPPLTAAIIGTRIYGGVKHVGYSTPKHVVKIVDALRNVDIDALVEQMDVEEFDRAGVYPDVWYREYESHLRQDLKNAFMELKQFYEKALARKIGVMAVITV